MKLVIVISNNFSRKDLSDKKKLSRGQCKNSKNMEQIFAETNRIQDGEEPALGDFA